MVLTSNVVARLSCYWHNLKDGLQQLLTTKVLLIMKLTTVLLFSACLMAGATGHSQQVTLKVKNTSLKEVFKEIKKQTGYSFAYNEGLISKSQPISLNLVNATLEQTLTACFNGQPYTYEIIDKTIVVKQKEATSPNEHATIPVNNEPPPIDISGKVTDKDGNPLAGASITVKGKAKLGAKTDAMGVFVLKGLEADDVITISYAEYVSQDFKVGSTTSFLVKLEPATGNLQEVVIKKGYYDEKQRFTLGNSVHIGKEVFEQSPVQNPMLALQGRVTGMEITQLTGMNGGGIKMAIQGINSINGGTDPFIVIDGVPVPSKLVGANFNPTMEGVVQGGSPLNYINPNDIESIDILKDADATSIYGSRAANGAIIITTRKGKAGRTKASINLQQGWGTVRKFAKMMNTRQYLDMRYEAFRNDGIALSTLAPSASNYDLTVWDTTRYTNWQKELLGGAAQFSNFSASLSGGTDAVNYIAMFTYNRRTVVFPGPFDDKVGNLHFGINSTSANRRFRMQLSGSYTYDQNHLPGVDLTNSAVLLEPVAPPLYNTDGSLNWALNAAGRSTWSNPLAYTLATDFINNTKNLSANASFSYSITPDLEISTTSGYTNMQNELYQPYRLEIYEPIFRPLRTRSAAFGTRLSSSWIIEPQLKYSKKIGKGKVEAFVASTIQKTSYSYFQIVASGFPSDQLMKTLRAATSSTITQSLSGITRYNALFGRLGFSWADKYLINLTARRDGSNKFGYKNRFHNFGSVGLGWIFSEEKFIQKALPFLSFGKLRITYGTTGNDGIPDFGYLSIYNINNPSVLYQGSIGLNANNLSNPFLQWEEVHKCQIGLDLGFLKDRILLRCTYSNNWSLNLLSSRFVPLVTGFQFYIKNHPDLRIQNTLLEFSLNTVNIEKKNFTWRSSVNLTKRRNKYLRVPDSFSDKSDLGRPLELSLVTQYAGVNPANGNYVIMDAKGNPISSNPSNADRNQLLSLVPPYYGGLQNSFRVKSFEIDFFFQFVRKIGFRDMYFSSGFQPGAFSNGVSNQPISVLDRWQKPGDNSRVGRYTTSGLNNVFLTSNARYSNEASFIGLENVSLSWTIPQKFLKKMRLQGGKLYVNGQNVATITKYRGLDLETMSASVLPPLRMITTGINVEF